MLSALALLALAAPQGAGPALVTVDAGRGPVDVRLPAGREPGEAMPLLVLLHGWTDQPESVEATFGVVPWLDAYGFAYARPLGTLDSLGRRFWDATSACCDFEGRGPDDSGYLRALVEQIRGALPVDPRRVYVAGHSNGGFMAHRLACEHADLFAAVVSLAGSSEAAPAACAPSEPVSVLHLHGDADALVPYLGGLFLGRPVPGAAAVAAGWGQALGCGPPVADPTPLDLCAGVPGPETTREAWAACPTNGAVELWTMHGVGHAPAPSAELAPRVLEWLLAHAKVGLAASAYCTPAPPNSTGRPGRLRATGSDVLARNDLVLVAEDLPPQSFGLFLGALGQLNVPLGPTVNGPLCVGPNVARLGASVLATGATGSFQLALDLRALPPVAPAGAATGEMWYFQAWHRDGAGSSLTDALAVRLR